MIYGDVKVNFMNISIHPKIQTLTITFFSRRADGVATIKFAEPAIKEKLPKSTFGSSKEHKKSVSFVDVDTWQKKTASSQLISTHINFMHNSTKMILKIFFFPSHSLFKFHS